MTTTPGSFSITNLSTSETRVMPVDSSFAPLRREAFHRKSLPAQRESINLTNIAGEGTINTTGLWRREQIDFSMGAGQQYLDRRRESQENRFLRSKGIDVFSLPLRAQLLPDTYRTDTISVPESSMKMSRCGDYVIIANRNTVYRFDSFWTSLTFTSDTIYGGVNIGTVYDITTNDQYVYIATSTGIWFSDPSNLSGGAPYFRLFAAPDATTGYTGGYGMVAWANDQIIAASYQNLSNSQFGNCLYAFQPRTATTFPTFGGVPSVGTQNLNIRTITVPGAGTDTTATVTTVFPHNIEAGQTITIENNKTVSSITGISLSGGYVTATCSNSHGLTEGEEATVRTQYANGHVINETIVVSTVNAYNQFTYPTQKISTVTGFSTGTVDGSNTYGFNATYTVTSVPDYPQVSITNYGVGGGGLVPGLPTGYDKTCIVYTTATAHGLAVGETVTISGMTPGAFNGQFRVQIVSDSTHFTVVLPNSATPSVTASSEATRAVLDFKINVPPEAANLGRGGYAVNSTPPDLLYKHQNDHYVWSTATGGETQIYLGGYIRTPNGRGSYGCVYRCNLLGSSTTSQTGTSAISSSIVSQPFVLDTPVQALPLSPDEYPTCIQSYLNFIFVGTNRGIRMCQTLSIFDPTATATGDLKSGPLSPNVLQPVTKPVTAIMGDGRYVWFAWSDYDATSTGLGKLDLQTFINGDPLAPAYASDLMVTGQGIINSIDWHPVGNYPMICVGGSGVYIPFATNEGGLVKASKFVAAGSITSGVFDYGISDQKIPMQFDYGAVAPYGSSVSASVVLEPLDVTLTQSCAVASFTSGSSTIKTVTTSPVYTKANEFQTTITLHAGSNATSQDTTPTLHRWTLRSWPTVVAGSMIMAVLNNSGETLLDGADYWHDPYDNFIWLENLRQAQTIIQYTEGPLSVVGVISDIDDHPEEAMDNYETGWKGPLVITITTLLPFVYTAPATH